MFAVHWVRSALDDLANLWVNAESSERSIVQTLSLNLSTMTQAGMSCILLSCGSANAG